MAIFGEFRRQVVEVALPDLKSWARRQGWLVALAQRLPDPWREWLAGLPARGLQRRLAFRRTRRWRQAALRAACAPEEPAIAASAQFGPHAGVNVFAYARGQFGLGEAARLYTQALLAAGYPVGVHDIALDVPHGMDDRSLEGRLGGEPRHAVNLVFANPDSLAAAIESIGASRFRGRYTIACWFWELEKFPEEWRPALSMVDEIMVSTRFVGDMLGAATAKPILHVPLPAIAAPDSGLQRRDFGLRPDAFLFLNSFDFNSYLPRKNPLAAIGAFRAAFPAGENVQLLVKSSNGYRHPQALRELLAAAASDPRIVVRDEVIDKCHVQALQRCADAYVSLHRAEGFGLGLAECMRLGKPVVATAWSGNMEFMTPYNSCLVGYRLVEVGADQYPHADGQRWAEPDIGQAAAHMRRLVHEPGLAARIGARAAADIAERLAPQRVAVDLVERLQELALRCPQPQRCDNGGRT
ncbi:MAG: glycosyltransferase [Pseudoxanthomonas sp.]